MKKSKLVGRLGIRILPFFTAGGLGDGTIPYDMYYVDNHFSFPSESLGVDNFSYFNNVLEQYNLEISPENKYDPILTSYPRR